MQTAHGQAESHNSYSPVKESDPVVLGKARKPTIHLHAVFYEKDCLVGLVVKAYASRAEDPEFESRLRRDFPGSSHTSNLKIGAPVVTLPGAWR